MYIYFPQGALWKNFFTLYMYGLPHWIIFSELNSWIIYWHNWHILLAHHHSVCCLLLLLMFVKLWDNFWAQHPLCVKSVLLVISKVLRRCSHRFLQRFCWCRNDHNIGIRKLLDLWRLMLVRWIIIGDRFCRNLDNFRQLVFLHHFILIIYAH